MSGNARAAAAQSLEAAAAHSASPEPLALAPFSPALIAEVRALVGKLDQDQRLWLSGFLAGLASQPALGLLAPPSAPAPALATVPGDLPQARPAVTVLFGSQTGNSERVAKQLADQLTAHGVSFTLLDMLRCTRAHLQDARILLLVVSTHGDGDPPERAAPLSELLGSRKAPRLEHVRYSVLALGDSSYEKFCEAGRQFDARLTALGAQRLHPREECDVEFEVPAHRWIEAIIGKLEHAPVPSLAALSAPLIPRRTASVSNAYTRKNPYSAQILANQRLTAHGSSKDVRHIELSLAGSSIHYEPGDSIGIVPRNRAEDVQELLRRLTFGAETPVPADAHSLLPLRQALIERLEIGPVSRALIKRYAEAIGAAGLKALASASDHDFARYARGRHLGELVTEHPPVGLDAAAFARLLPPLAPRLYSIASSQQVAPEEAHLTVSVVQYDSFERRRWGVVSGSLAQLADDAEVPIYLHRNPAFRLPEDPGAAVIMIGPGTGVAPFRAFLAEREHTGASGKNWLFFGDRTFEWDFLYQAEWLEWRRRGVLARLDTAFSRDQQAKLYVQHRLLEHGAELWRWLEDGAYLYVCGDAAQMAPDVHRALLEVVAVHGGRGAEYAAEYVLELQQSRRYQRDVY